jgi:UDP-2-acetamido-2,6-beta-L-arabino-hexul-4-ose reductase
MLPVQKITKHPKVIGGGMVARAFASPLLNHTDVIIYASGVSNSDCADLAHFERERTLLSASLSEASGASPFIYFGTCSVYDPDAQKKDYVRHKLEMEALVLSHPQGRVIRLPQIAGPKPSPNTLIASLVAKVRAGVVIQVWQDAVRNIIDIEDVVRIVQVLATQNFLDKRVINVANPKSISVMDLIHAIEYCLDICSRVEIIKKGALYEIDTHALRDIVKMAGVDFGPNYLVNAIKKYYI